MTQESQLKEALRKLINGSVVIVGTEELTLRTANANCRTWVLKQARALEAEGVITIHQSRGGRGHKTVYKRNPNQPGQPRRRRGAKR